MIELDLEHNNRVAEWMIVKNLAAYNELRDFAQTVAAPVPTEYAAIITRAVAAHVVRHIASCPVGELIVELN
ncbi:MAG: hypothetical protein WCD76_08885 [Pyrinomonadaceae bacterium]